jgi:hypothetical protein
MKELLIILVLILVYLLFRAYRRREYFRHDPLIGVIKRDVSQLDPRIASLEFYSSDESYTEDKRRIYLCLRDENGEYYDYNMLIYVAIHECSHALTDVVDIHHITPEFRGMFQKLLTRATELGIYSPVEPLVSNYCGLSLQTENLQR